jgi:pimeloyl-ACP methyl ester carboxylesterase
MNRRKLLRTAAASAALGLAQSVIAKEAGQVNTGYVKVNGLNMYYERHGSGGVPLVLLHGAFSAIGTSFGAMLPALSAHREVIAFELQGHGHTADIDRPLALASLASDVAGALDQLGVTQADVFGYSLGGGAALQLVLDRPDLVRKVILASLAYSKAGYPPGFVEAMQGVTVDMLKGSPWEQEYAQLAPNPGDFGQLLEKIKAFNANLPDFAEDRLKAIAQPCLLISGDADNASVEHMGAFHKLVGGGVPVTPMGTPRSWLHILPGTSHVLVPGRGDLIVPSIEAFLAA